MPRLLIRWLLTVVLVASSELLVAAEDPAAAFVWLRDAKPVDKDYYVAFRGQWEQAAEGEVEIDLLGASWFVTWLDGAYFAEGPARFPAEFPQYQTHRTRLGAGRHTLAVQVHHIGQSTRMLDNPEPFLHCIVKSGGREVAARWKCCRIGGYASQVKRINPELGFIEWCDTRLVPHWQAPGYDDKPWAEPVAVSPKLGKLTPLSTAVARSLACPAQAVALGSLVESFGYELDNPAARFFLRGLSAEKLPAQGVWRRYDLGRVRLMRPRLMLDVPAGAVVEFAYSEVLHHARVSPWITLSAGDSCNLDHYVARGGLQEFFPLTPKGGRFVEVHVLAPPEQVRFVREEFLERCYYGEPQGTFHCDDPLLNRIWTVGVETHRACSEDALIDNPTRERGQWAGDVVTVGMDIAGAAFSDLRLCRRGLVQSAQGARNDGLVAGLCPGGREYLSTYAAQWVTACVHYWELTGEIALLTELFKAAERNIAAFEKHRTAEGLQGAVGWGFVDWGYVPNPGSSDMAVNLHYLAAVRDMVRWCDALGRRERAAHYRSLQSEISAVVARYFQSELKRRDDCWSRIGYHRAVLGLRAGFFSGDDETACVREIKSHMLRCFPNDPTAPRLSDPSAANPRLISPYFGHFAMHALIERGEMDFVLSQYRKCWGWALEDGRSTWLEVFDTRWSHCHQWAGCPTWQMSRYLLGLRPRMDLGERTYEVAVQPGSLRGAQGSFPLPGGGAIQVQWTREPNGLRYHLQTPTPICLRLPDEGPGSPAKTVQVEREFEAILK